MKLFSAIQVAVETLWILDLVGMTEKNLNIELQENFYTVKKSKVLRKVIRWEEQKN